MFMENSDVQIIENEYKKLCNNYRQTYKKEHLAALISYAKDDVDKGKFTWAIFVSGLRNAGRNNDFFPNYAKIIKEVVKLVDESNRNTSTPERFLLESHKKSNSKAADETFYFMRLINSDKFKRRPKKEKQSIIDYMKTAPVNVNVTNDEELEFHVFRGKQEEVDLEWMN
jgi:hypothetical protein